MSSVTRGGVEGEASPSEGRCWRRPSGGRREGRRAGGEPQYVQQEQDDTKKRIIVRHEREEQDSGRKEDLGGIQVVPPSVPGARLQPFLPLPLLVLLPIPSCHRKRKPLSHQVSRQLNRAQPSPPHGPRIRRASWMSFCMIVTRFAWIAHKFLPSETDPSRTRNVSIRGDRCST